jgi:hypothetical protein
MRFSRLHITIFLGLAVITWGMVLLVSGTPVGREHIAPFSAVVSVLVLLGLAFEHILWRQPWLHGWLVKRPDLRGTWRVELKSGWTDPQNGEETALIVCYMGVEQTLSKLQMHMMTLESESWLIAEGIRLSPSGKGYQVAGIYTNKPQMHLRGDRSEIHQGTFILDTHGSPARPDTMTGEYWTDRKTSGRMNFTIRVSEIVTRFDEAERLFASERVPK